MTRAAAAMRGWLARVRGPHSMRSDAATALDVLSVGLFAGFWLLAASQWGGAGLRDAAIALVMLPLGLALADLATGLVHWFADRFFDEDTPLLGPALIYAFREHHADPRGMERHGFFEVSGNNALACALLVALLVWRGPGTTLASHALHALGLWLALAMFATNQLHKWAHSRRAPRAVRWLQQRGWVLSPRAHARHHARDHRRAYCVTVGWLNAPLDRMQFFDRAETLVRTVQQRMTTGGDAPRRLVRPGPRR